MLTLPLTLFATARSSLPSRLKSPTASELGPDSTLKSRAVWKVPSPLPNRMLTFPPSLLATAKSSLPSPLKSPTATGQVQDRWLESSIAVAQEYADIASGVTVGCYGQVQLAVAIEISHRDGVRKRPGPSAVANGRLEGSVAVAQEDTDVVSLIVCYD